MYIIIAIIFGIVEGIWRRIYGGWIHATMKEKLPTYIYNALSMRFIQTIFNIILLFIIFTYNDTWQQEYLPILLQKIHIPFFVIALALACIVQFVIWAPAHGPAFDIGRDKCVTETMIKRYEKVFWAKALDKIIPKANKYNFLYDFIWMSIRYTLGPLLLLPFIGSTNILFLGIIIAGIYSFCWTLYENDQWVKNHLKYNIAECPTELAELLAGFLIGFYFAI